MQRRPPLAELLLKASAREGSRPVAKERKVVHQETSRYYDLPGSEHACLDSGQCLVVPIRSVDPITKLEERCGERAEGDMVEKLTVMMRSATQLTIQYAH